MRVLLSKFLLNLAGWKLGPVGEDVPKCVVCVAPHTSNWDFIVGKLFYSALDRDAGFLIKKDWFFFPFNLFFSWLGGVPVDRDDDFARGKRQAARYFMQWELPRADAWLDRLADNDDTALAMRDDWF